MDDPKRPHSADRDFLDRLSDLDRNLPVSGERQPAAPPPAEGWDDFAERRRSSATAPRDPRPLLDLFPPVEPDPRPAHAAPLDLPPAAGSAFPDRAPDDDVVDEPDEEYLDEAESPRRLAALAATFLVALAAGATAAAYLFREDLAAIIAAWQSP